MKVNYSEKPLQDVEADGAPSVIKSSYAQVRRFAASMIVFYVSGHGFGHATRALALIRRLRARPPRQPVQVRTTAPAWLFEEDPGLEVLPAVMDEGMVQSNGLDVDLAATLAAHERLGEEWEALVAREAASLKAAGARLVISDIPALPLAAAGQAGVPSAAVSNFSWDWILGFYADREERWRPVARRYAEAYAQAKVLFRLPLHAPFPAFRRIEDVPLLVRRSSADRAQTRRRLGIREGDRRPLVLVTFGGLGVGRLSFRGGDELGDFLFVGFSSKPEGLKADWIEFPARSPLPHVDVMAAADAAISKPGYGTLAEALAHRVPLLLLPRPDYPEGPVVSEAFLSLGHGGWISRQDFDAGRWRAALEALLCRPGRWSVVDSGGDEAVAARLLSLA